MVSALGVAPTADAGAANPSQILVLGMHHSGTSIISNLTMMLGAYGGAKDEMLLHAEVPALALWMPWACYCCSEASYARRARFVRRRRPPLTRPQR